MRWGSHRRLGGLYEAKLLPKATQSAPAGWGSNINGWSVAEASSVHPWQNGWDWRSCRGSRVAQPLSAFRQRHLSRTLRDGRASHEEVSNSKQQTIKERGHNKATARRQPRAHARAPCAVCPRTSASFMQTSGDDSDFLATARALARLGGGRTAVLRKTYCAPDRGRASRVVPMHEQYLYAAPAHVALADCRNRCRSRRPGRGT